MFLGQVAGARWAKLPLHLLPEHMQRPKVDSMSSITRLVNFGGSFLFPLSLSLRLERVQQLHVTAPPNVFSLATFRLILESFTSLQEMVIDLPGIDLWRYRMNDTDLIAIAKELDTRSISCCISDMLAHMFVSPSVDLIKRKPATSYVFLYTWSLLGDLSEIIGTAPRGGIGKVLLLSKLTGDATNLESCLKKIVNFIIWREAADLEVLEEEMAAVNVVLNLLADEKKKRGRLRYVMIPRVLLLRCIDWVERLGGKEEVERRSDQYHVSIRGHVDGNLRMF